MRRRPGGAALRRASSGALLAAVLGGATRAHAFVLTEDEIEDTSTEVGLVARTYGFVLSGKTLAPPLSPEDANPSGVNIEDLRAYFSYRSTHLRLVLHQATTSVVRSHASLGALSVGRGATPPRWLPLRATASGGETFRLATETDWAYAAYAEGRVTVTVGRQPVTLGRGRIFHPWDVVSTFSLTEVDTEYKPGVDAVRVAVSPSAATTLDLVAAVGELPPDDDFQIESRGSSFVLTLKQSFGPGELSGFSGLVRNDAVLGYGAVWSFRALDLYTETTATFLRRGSLSSPAVQGRAAPVARAVLGASFRPVSHVTVIPEIYYDGFGARRPRELLPVLLSARVGVGEQTTLGRLYAGAAVDWEAHPLLHVTALALSDALDPSALFSLALAYDASENTRVVAGAYAPVGAAPRATPVPSPQSEFGLFPNFGFVELRVAL